MKLISNWKAVALKSWSMWCIYLGIALLVLPEILYVLYGLNIDPRIPGWGGLGLLIAGGVGRLLDQGIDRGRLRSPWWVAAIALVLFAVPGEARSAEVDQREFLTVAVPFVGKWEGKRNHAYLDVVGVPTICFGHTKGVQLGDHMTDAQCEELLRIELLEYREGLHRYFTAETLAGRLTPERDTALVSLAYNVGIRGAGRSTAVRRLNAGNIAGCCDALTWWNKAGGRVWRGLVLRRGDEYDLCMVGVA